MRPERIPTTEQITLIILALLNDQSTFKQYEAERFTNALAVDDIELMTRSSLLSMQIKFRYTPVDKRDALPRPIDYQLYIVNQEKGGTVKTVLITLQALINDEWVHQPISNLSFVLEKLQAHGL